MSTLSNIEKMKLGRIFRSQNGPGYVMDFTNNSFQDFILRSVNKDIYLDKYALNGGSKEKRLHAFWDIESDPVIGKLTTEMLEYWEAKKSLSQEIINNQEQILFDECKHIANRLLDKAPTIQLTENEFIQKEFKNISLEKINLDSGIIRVLEQRLSEIQKCLTAKSPLAVIFLCGSTLEGILLGIASNKSREFNTTKASPKDKLTGKVLPFPKWSLANFIDSARELGIVGEDVKKFSHALRDFRNYIHPYEQLATNFYPDQHTAEICWKVLQAAISHISENK